MYNQTNLISFDPPVKLYSSEYIRVWQLLEEMDLKKNTGMIYTGNTELKGLCFPDSDTALIFKLRL